MSVLKKFLLILTVWAYALQAVAGVSSLPCSAHASMAVPVAPVMAGMPEHHQMAGMHHMAADDMTSAEGHHYQAAAGSSDCDDCKCPPAGCACSGHGCSSSPGVVPTRSVGLDDGAVVADTPFAPASPHQAFRQGLIRPPSIS